MKTRKITAIFAAAFLALASISGCGDASSESGSESTELSTEEPTEPETEHAFSADSYPSVIGASFLSETETALRTALISEAGESYETTVSGAYEALKDGSADVILVPSPSYPEQALTASEKNRYRFTAFANEGLVFFVHKENPVNDLSKEQILSIFAGKTDNWSAVGGSDLTATPCFQDADSVSGIAASSFGLKPGDESVMASSVDLLRDRSYIGFTTMQNYLTLYKGAVKLLSVGGIAPNDSTIRAAEYPYLLNYTAVSKNDCTEETEAFLETLLKKRGQTVVRDAGLSPIVDVGFIGHEDNHVDDEEFSLDKSFLYRQDSLLFVKKHASYEGVGFRYPSIDGLLNDEIEERVNLRLFSDVLDQVKTIVPLPDGAILESETELKSAFQNTLSVLTTLTLTIPKEEGEPKTKTYLIPTNAELLSGSRISFAKLFNEGTEPAEILPSSIREAVAELAPEGEDPEEALASLYRALPESLSFSFDEQAVTIYSDVFGETITTNVRFEDAIQKTAVYHRYASEEEIYDGNYRKESLLPVFMIRKGDSWAEIVERNEDSYIDAAFYCNENSEAAHEAAVDVVERLKAYIAGKKANAAGPYVENLSLTMYEMKNAQFDGHPAAYYVAMQDHTYTLRSGSLFNNAYEKVVAFLRSDESSVLKENLFLPHLVSTGVFPGERITYQYVNWYYDADGHFLGER